MSLVDGSQTAYRLQEKPHDRGRSPPGPEDNYTSGAAISSTEIWDRAQREATRCHKSDWGTVKGLKFWMQQRHVARTQLRYHI